MPPTLVLEGMDPCAAPAPSSLMLEGPSVGPSMTLMQEGPSLGPSVSIMKAGPLVEPSMGPSVTLMKAGPSMGPSVTLMKAGPSVGPSVTLMKAGPSVGPSVTLMKAGPSVGPSVTLIQAGPSVGPSVTLMKAGPSVGPSLTLIKAGPSLGPLAGPPLGPSVWRLSGRSRKAGSANIFSSVHLWQLQRLFRAAGDQDAEQRAQLVWGQGDEGGLAQALIALRSRGHRRGLRSRGRDVLQGAHWIRAFNHLRIGESSGQTGTEPEETRDPETSPPGLSVPSPPSPPSPPGAREEQGPGERLGRSMGVRRGGGEADRYLHRILH
ncbi:unnamed protein product [Knipowitschia caucasica]